MIDIIIAIIIIIFAFVGFRNGFVLTVLRLASWVVAVVVALLFSGVAEKFLKNHTGIEDRFFDNVFRICLDSYNKYAVPATEGLTEVIGDAAESFGYELVTETARRIADISFSVLVFLIIVVAVRLVIFFIMLLLSKKYHRGLIGTLDGIAGLILGFIQGSVVILVLLAFVVPLSYTINENFYSSVQNALDRSYYAKDLYENNPLISLSGGKFPTEFRPSYWLENLPESEGEESKN